MHITFDENQSFNIPIPRIFYSFFHEGMFPECTVCSKKLLNGKTSYFIEKAYQKGEVVFEYAMCEECRDEMSTEISSESLMNLADYFMKNGNLIERRATLLQNFDNTAKPWLEKCLFTEKKRSECESYQICAECEGRNLTLSFLPFMISETATEEIQSLISKQTRESFNRFTRDVLNPPVDLKNIPILI